MHCIVYNVLDCYVNKNVPEKYNYNNWSVFPIILIKSSLLIVPIWLLILHMLISINISDTSATRTNGTRPFISWS